MSTKIRKSPDTPSEFQLQPNEEPIQHALGQVPTCQKTRNLDQLLGNPCAAEPVKEVVEHKSSLEIVEEEVLVDFNTEKVPVEFSTETEDHSPQEKMTGKLDSFLDGFLDGFGIVDAVPADLNTEQHPRDCKGPFPGLTRAHNGLQLQNNNYNFKSPGICQEVRRSAHSTKGVPPRRHPPFREDIVLSTQCAQMLSSDMFQP